MFTVRSSQATSCLRSSSDELRGFGRRHFAGADPVEDVLPRFAGRRVGIGVERRQIEFVVFFFRVMTLVAILGQQRLHVVLERGLIGPGDGRRADEAERPQQRQAARQAMEKPKTLPHRVEAWRVGRSG